MGMGMKQRLDIDRAVTPGGIVAPASVLVDGTRVTAVATPSALGDVDAPVTRHPGTLVPGFVDLQVNGAAGHQYGSGSGGLRATAAALLATGVTAHCPTVTSRAWDRYAEALAGLGAPGGPAAPRNLGLHLEGPFLSPRQPGAHDPGVLVEPSARRVDELLEWAGSPVAIVTLAPELPGAHRAVGRLRNAGVVVSAGHTDATYGQLRAAVGVGVSMVTHVFNAQRGLHHREPGVAGGALLLDELRVSVILDGVHVHPDVAALALRVAAGRAFAVTDAMATAGLAPGRHELDGWTVDTTSGAPRLEDGTLAGSNLTMDAAFRFAAGACGLSEAVKVASTTPARAIGRDDLGVLAAGAAADLVLLDDDLLVAAVWRDGVRVV